MGFFPPLLTLDACQEPILVLCRHREEKKRETLGSLAETELFSAKSVVVGGTSFLPCFSIRKKWVESGLCSP